MKYLGHITMNSTATSYSSGLSPWKTPNTSRRNSVESVCSIQGKETDFVRDTSDTDASAGGRADDAGLEYEPVTESDDDAPIVQESSGDSDDAIIATKVIAVSVRDDGELSFADAEADESEESDGEIDLYDYWQCAQCRADNNTPLYRYCQKCFQVRKNLFPPRPKRKPKRAPTDPDTHTHIHTDVTDSGVDSAFNSQELSQESHSTGPRATAHSVPTGTADPKTGLATSASDLGPGRRRLKRKADRVDRDDKRAKTDFTDSDSVDTDTDVQPLVKSVSDPIIAIESDPVKLTKKAIANGLREKLDSSKEDLCIICFSEPKSGVFVHGRIAHICCCYKCSVKVWAKAKRCPVCNCKVSNVLKAVVM